MGSIFFWSLGTINKLPDAPATKVLSLLFGFPANLFMSTQSKDCKSRVSK